MEREKGGGRLIHFLVEGLLAKKKRKTRKPSRAELKTTNELTNTYVSSQPINRRGGLGLSPLTGGFQICNRR